MAKASCLQSSFLFGALTIGCTNSSVPHADVVFETEQAGSIEGNTAPLRNEMRRLLQPVFGYIDASTPYKAGEIRQIVINTLNEQQEAAHCLTVAGLTGARLDREDTAIYERLRNRLTIGYLVQMRRGLAQAELDAISCWLRHPID